MSSSRHSGSRTRALTTSRTRSATPSRSPSEDGKAVAGRRRPAAVWGGEAVMKKVLTGVVAIFAIAVAIGLNSCGGGGTGGGQTARPPVFVLDPAGTSSNSGTLVLSIDRNSIDANN